MELEPEGCPSCDRPWDPGLCPRCGSEGEPRFLSQLLEPEDDEISELDDPVAALIYRAAATFPDELSWRELQAFLDEHAVTDATERRIWEWLIRETKGAKSFARQLRIETERDAR